MRSVWTAVGLTGVLLMGACSSPSAPEAGNQIETVAPISDAPSTVAATSTPVGAEASIASSALPTTEPVASQPATTVAVFVPPSTTLPDDPDLREAIRVRIAVATEFRRQARAGIADPKAFTAIADPDFWIPEAVAELESRRVDGTTAKPNSVDGISVLAATRQSEGEIALTTCAFNDDIVTRTFGTPNTNDDQMNDALTLTKASNLMVRKEGRWLLRGSVVLASGSC